MENPQSRTIADVFSMLDCWRHLPKYRLEPQVAPFFALFLSDVFRQNKKLDVEIHPIVIPEFPLRIGTLRDKCCCQEPNCPLRNGAHPNQSYNVDYFVLSQSRTKAFLVELKTDMGSIVADQQCYLKRAAEVGIGPLIEGVTEISKNSRKGQKYVHLQHRLSKLGFCGNVKKCGVIYVQPEQPKDNERVESFTYIDFEDVADVVQGCGELGAIFANYLRQWTDPAGERKPEQITHYR